MLDQKINSPTTKEEYYVLTHFPIVIATKSHIKLHEDVINQICNNKTVAVGNTN